MRVESFLERTKRRVADPHSGHQSHLQRLILFVEKASQERICVRRDLRIIERASEDFRLLRFEFSCHDIYSLIPHREMCRFDSKLSLRIEMDLAALSALLVSSGPVGDMSLGCEKNSRLAIWAMLPR